MSTGRTWTAADTLKNVVVKIRPPGADRWQLLRLWGYTRTSRWRTTASWPLSASVRPIKPLVMTTERGDD
jgi:hypothetical protein